MNELSSVAGDTKPTERVPMMRHIVSFTRDRALCGAEIPGVAPRNEWGPVSTADCHVCAEIYERMGREGQLALHRFWGGES